jgi:hypothetical protein
MNSSHDIGSDLGISATGYVPQPYLVYLSHQDQRLIDHIARNVGQVEYVRYPTSAHMAIMYPDHTAGIDLAFLNNVRVFRWDPAQSVLVAMDEDFFKNLLPRVPDSGILF